MWPMTQGICGAEVGEMTNLHTGHLQQGVGAHLAEAEAGEGHALQARLIFARLEVDQELLLLPAPSSVAEAAAEAVAKAVTF